MLRMIDGSLESFVVEMLSKASLQRRLTESLIERALSRDVNKDEYILLEEGKWIKMSNLLKYRYIQRAINKVNILIVTSNQLGNIDVVFSMAAVLSSMP